MKILIVHNSYRDAGGEDTVANQEVELLRNAGQEVVQYLRSNKEVERFTPIQKIALPLNIIWSFESKAALKTLVRDFQPDIVHFHNTFFLISPAPYYACKLLGVPVVQTIQNYRFLCPAATFFRNGSVCEKCLGKTIPIYGFLYGCYRESRMSSAIPVTMLGLHNTLKTFRRCIDQLIAVTDFAKHKLLEAGFPSEQISVKPNIISPDPGVSAQRDEYAIFIGRFVQEKGVLTLLDALEMKSIPIKMLGSGNLASVIQQKAKRIPAIDVVGWSDRDRMFSYLKKARFLIFPSEWYEGFPLAIAEAFACGVPVIASNIGSMSEIIMHGKTGLFFRAGDSRMLAATIGWAREHKAEMEVMGQNARKEFEQKYSATRNYDMLMTIYAAAIRSAQGKSRANSLSRSS